MIFVVLVSVNLAIMLLNLTIVSPPLGPWGAAVNAFAAGRCTALGWSLWSDRR